MSLISLSHLSQTAYMPQRCIFVWMACCSCCEWITISVRTGVAHHWWCTCSIMYSSVVIVNRTAFDYADIRDTRSWKSTGKIRTKMILIYFFLLIDINISRSGCLNQTINICIWFNNLYRHLYASYEWYFGRWCVNIQSEVVV